MNPNQQPPQQLYPAPQQPSGQFTPGQYDFITNPASKPKRSLLPSFGSGKKRILIIALIVVGLFTFFLLVGSLLFGGNKGSKSQLLTVAKDQTEIVRVADIGVQKAGSTQTRSFAENIKLIMLTDQNAVVASLGKNGKKVKAKELTKAPDTSIDQKLTTAEQNGTFDQVFTTTMKELLNKYLLNVKLTNQQIKSISGKQALSDTYDNAGMLIQQADFN